MKVFESKDQLVIDHPLGGRRLIAELFESEKGLVFVDTWWWESSGNPFHEVVGKITGDGPEWEIESADVWIEPLDMKDELDLLVQEYQEWKKWKRRYGKEATRELAARLVKEEGFKIKD